MAKHDIKQMMFELADYEKQISGMGRFTEEDEKWFNKELGFDNGFENDDVYGIGVQEILELISDFIAHCDAEEVY